MAPFTPTVALVGSVGYEDIEISERDALRDLNGVPIFGDDGRLITNKHPRGCYPTIRTGLFGIQEFCGDQASEHLSKHELVAAMAARPIRVTSAIGPMRIHP